MCEEKGPRNSKKWNKTDERGWIDLKDKCCATDGQMVSSSSAFLEERCLFWWKNCVNYHQNVYFLLWNFQLFNFKFFVNFKIHDQPVWQKSIAEFVYAKI